VRNVEIPGATQQLLNGKSHDFLAIFGWFNSKITQFDWFLSVLEEKRLENYEIYHLEADENRASKGLERYNLAPLLILQ
jgi:hypothetical protein